MNGWARKIETRDVVVAAAISALLGAVLSWLIFVWVGDPAKGFGFGSLADWAAAAGTWAIGYGAWKYAREAHQLRQSEVRSNEARALKSDAGALLSVRSQFETVYNCANIFSNVESFEGDLVDAPGLAASVVNVTPFLKRIAWSHTERSGLDGAALVEIGAIEVNIETLTEFGALFVDELRKQPKKMVARSTGRAHAILTTAMKLCASSQRAIAAIDLARDQLLADAAALEVSKLH